MVWSGQFGRPGGRPTWPRGETHRSGDPGAPPARGDPGLQDGCRGGQSPWPGLVSHGDVEEILDRMLGLACRFPARNRSSVPNAYADWSIGPNVHPARKLVLARRALNTAITAPALHSRQGCGVPLHLPGGVPRAPRGKAADRCGPTHSRRIRIGGALPGSPRATGEGTTALAPPPPPCGFLAWSCPRGTPHRLRRASPRRVHRLLARHDVEEGAVPGALHFLLGGSYAGKNGCFACRCAISWPCTPGKCRQ